MAGVKSEIQTTCLKYPKRLIALTEDEYRSNLNKLDGALFLVTDRTDTISAMAVGYCQARSISVIAVGLLPCSLYHGAYLKMSRTEWYKYVEQFSGIGTITELEPTNENQSPVQGTKCMDDVSV